MSCECKNALEVLARVLEKVVARLNVDVVPV